MESKLLKKVFYIAIYGIFLQFICFNLVFSEVREDQKKGKEPSAKPEVAETSIKILQDIAITGKVTDENAQGLPGVSILVKGTNTGTVVDKNGEFKMETPKKFTLVVSFVGYKTTQGSFGSKNGESMEVMMNMKKGVFNIELPDVSGENVNMQAPPPPPPKVDDADKDKVFMIVEEMPYYSNGGMTKLALDIRKEIDWVVEKTNDRGEVIVGFTVSASGNILNPQVVKSANSNMLDASAVKIIAKLDNWNPGVQRGKKVPVDLTVPIKFE